jgi:uncharacterized protein YoaH (UPF0181 family)
VRFTDAEMTALKALADADRCSPRQYLERLAAGRRSTGRAALRHELRRIGLTLRRLQEQGAPGISSGAAADLRAALLRLVRALRRIGG